MSVGAGSGSDWEQLASHLVDEEEPDEDILEADDERDLAELMAAATTIK